MLAEGRLAHVYPNGFAPTFWPERLEQPLKHRQRAGVFVCSMGEIFDPQASWEWRDQVWDVIERCPKHVFFVLTKQPKQIDLYEIPKHPNFWIGVSVDKPGTGQRLLELAFRTSAGTKRFVSFEPLLGPVGDMRMDIAQWVIIGQDSRPGQPRPQVEWVQGIIDQARGLGIPVFLKPPLVDWWVAEGHGEKLQEWPEVCSEH